MATPRAQRHLSKNESDRLTANLEEIKGDVPIVIIGYSSGDEPATYVGDFVDAVNNTGITPFVLPMYAEPGECGVMVGVIDVDHPSERAQKCNYSPPGDQGGTRIGWPARASRRAWRAERPCSRPVAMTDKASA